MVLEKLRSYAWMKLTFFCLGAMFVVGLYIFSSIVSDANNCQPSMTEAKVIIITPAPSGDSSDDYKNLTMMEPLQRENMIAYMRMVNPKLSIKIANRLADGILDNYYEYKLPINIQLGLITNESRFKQFARGSSGDLGFMQVVMKIHHKRVNRMYAHHTIKNKNIFDPYTNARVGGAILHDCLKMKNGNMKEALLCYNGSTDDVEETYAKKVFKFTKNVPTVLASL